MVITQAFYKADEAHQLCQRFTNIYRRVDIVSYEDFNDYFPSVIISRMSRFSLVNSFIFD